MTTPSGMSDLSIRLRAARPNIWLSLFCFALMGPACAINGAFVALAIPAMAPYGYPGLMLFATVGFVLGILPARWMARKIHAGISGQP